MFRNLHPWANLMYFALVTGFGIAFEHPYAVGVGFACALGVYGWENRGGGVAFLYRFVLPVMLFPLLINPLVNHTGATVLFDLPWGSHVTMESVVYGVLSSARLCTVCLWFSYFSSVMTQDKLMYFSGRFLPTLTLLISMTLRFIPALTRQYQRIVTAQEMLGSGRKDLKGVRRIGNTLTCFSALVTFSLQYAGQTADSMKSRGYGVGKATSYRIYSLKTRDRDFLFCLLLCALPVLAAGLQGSFKAVIFPEIRISFALRDIWFVFVFYAALCLLPVINDCREGYRWKRSRSLI